MLKCKFYITAGVNATCMLTMCKADVYLLENTHKSIRSYKVGIREYSSKD